MTRPRSRAKTLTIQIKSAGEALEGFREAFKAVEAGRRVSRREGVYFTSIEAARNRLTPNRLDLWKTAGAIYLYDLDDSPSALRCFRYALTLEADPAERARLEDLIQDLGG